MVLDICIYWKVIFHNFNLAIKGQKAKYGSMLWLKMDKNL